MSLSHRYRRALGHVIVAATTATVIVAGTPLLAAASTRTLSPASRPRLSSPPTFTLGNDGAPVTVNKQAWILSIQYTSDSPANSLAVNLERIVTAGGNGIEGHGWQFAYASKSALTFSTASGDGTLNTGSTYNPVVSVDLTFKAKSHKAAACTSGSETVYTGTLTGTAVLNTGLALGGTAGGRSLTFNVKGSAPSVTADSGCVISLNDCASVTIFSSGKSGIIATGAVGSEFGAKVNDASVIKQTKLSAPKGASRIDLAYLEGPKLAWNSKTHVLSVSTSSSGIVTGSATLSGGSPKTETVPCVFSGKKYTLTETYDADPTYSSPSGEVLTGHTSLTGNLAAPAKSTTAGYEVVTVS